MTLTIPAPAMPAAPAPETIIIVEPKDAFESAFTLISSPAVIDVLSPPFLPTVACVLFEKAFT